MYALHSHDFYKADHRRQYPAGITQVYSNFTPRQSRVPGIEKVVPFGLQGFVRTWLQGHWFTSFFAIPVEEAVRVYKRRLDLALGIDAVPVSHIYDLHTMRRLPLLIKAVPEGLRIPMQCPMLTIRNTDSRFAWLTNFVETQLSAELWGPCTSATIAFQYRLEFERAARRTGADRSFIPWQGHDFSMRGMWGVDAAQRSGAAHLLSFTGTDTVPALDYLEAHYGADAAHEVLGGSVPATEHAVMCADTPENELETFRRLLRLYPKNVLSIVSDSWDFWRVVTEYLPLLEKEIMERDGKLVIRPDSGDPVAVLCGVPSWRAESPAERAGLVETLWELFGGYTNEMGYKVLDSHIGVIYGDSITLDRQREILKRLGDKGFASSNVVLGIGSYTYQHVTRDTFGWAMKATHCVVNGEPRDIYKAPRTDPGKNSARGLIRVDFDSKGLVRMYDGVSEEEESGGLLEPVFEDGELVRFQTLRDIRARITAELIHELGESW